MAEIDKKWPYAFCPDCQHLCPIIVRASVDENGNIRERTCLSCQKEIIVDTPNTIVFFDKTEAELRKLPIVKAIQGEE